MSHWSRSSAEFRMHSNRTEETSRPKHHTVHHTFIIRQVQAIQRRPRPSSSIMPHEHLEHHTKSRASIDFESGMLFLFRFNFANFYPPLRRDGLLILAMRVSSNQENFAGYL
jgi:hypothetical protein